MSQEISISTSLRVNKGNLNYQSYPTGMRIDLTGIYGPSPGLVLVPVAGGLDVTFPNLTVPAVCWLQNQSIVDGNYVTVGVRDSSTNEFYPLDEIQPGEFYIKRISRHLGQHYIGTGTGAGSPVSYLHLRAALATAGVRIDAFEA